MSGAAYGDLEVVEYPCGCAVRWVFTYGAQSNDAYWQGTQENTCDVHRERLRAG